MGKTLTEPAATPYAEALLLCDNKQVEEDLLTVSYTHLTLPTSDLV